MVFLPIFFIPHSADAIPMWFQIGVVVAVPAAGSIVGLAISQRRVAKSEGLTVAT